MSQINIPISDLTKCITVEVRITGHKIWLVKLWAGKTLIKIAACVMGVNVEIEVNESKE